MHDKRWKILTVVEATAAGVGRHVSDLTRGIDLDRFDVTLAWSPVRSDQSFRDAVEALEARGVHTRVVPMTRGMNPVTDFKAFASLVRLIRRGGFDLVHVHSSKAGFLGRLAAAVARPSAVRVYSPNSISISFNRAYWYPEKLAGWVTDALIAVSESEREELVNYRLVPGHKVMRVTAGIPLPEGPTEDVAGIRAELGIPADAVVIGTVGRVSYQKDPETFLETAKRVLAAESNVRFVWVGPGEQLPDIQCRAKDMGIADRIVFTGYRQDAQRLMEAFDIFLLTSRYESFGYVTCEAMALGKPVVASRVTGSIELVEEGVTGLLADSGDAERFASFLLELIPDAGRRQRMGAAGRARAEQFFSVRRMVSEMEQLYTKLLEARKPSGARGGLLGISAEAR